MTGPRRRTAQQESLLQTIANAAAQERVVRVQAEAEARAMIEAKTKTARTKTNALMYQAHYEYGITKTAITADGLGTTNRQAADTRIREHMQENGIGDVEAISTRMEARTAAPVETRVGIEVNVASDGVYVHLDDYTHPDLGEHLSGLIHFQSGGDSYVMSNENEALGEAESDPLWSMRLWDVDAVQEATR